MIEELIDAGLARLVQLVSRTRGRTVSSGYAAINAEDRYVEALPRQLAELVDVADEVGPHDALLVGLLERFDLLKRPDELRRELAMLAIPM